MRIAIFCLAFSFAAAAQQVPGSAPPAVPGYTIITSKEQPTVGPGEILLIQLEGKFAKAVAEAGGKAYADWFASDAVVLNNGKPALIGRGAIVRDANWSPKDYQLTWTAQGAQMGPSNDMGFTWGHYEGKSMGLDGKPVVTTGRYITIWKKQANGDWKVAMDAGANEPAAADCCTVKQP
jgi:ketosteroid isomerase-like protein